MEYDQVITGLWVITAHFTEQLVKIQPVAALTELCLKLFRYSNIIEHNFLLNKLLLDKNQNYINYSFFFLVVKENNIVNPEL